MNKRVLIALAAVSVLVLALIVWAGFAALGYFWRQAPAVIEGGRADAPPPDTGLQRELAALRAEMRTLRQLLQERASETHQLRLGVG